MSHRSYVGIDNTDQNEWVVALLCQNAIILSKPFKNTPDGLHDLVRFISSHGIKPKICFKPNNSMSLELIKFISDIPDVEVVLISHAGFKMHQSWLPKAIATTSNSTLGYTGQAQLLAYCAERIA